MNIDTEDFVTYEQALALKKLGFDTETYLWYAEYANTKKLFGFPTPQGDVVLRNWNSTLNQISAPTLAQAQKWLRINKKLYISVFFKGNTTWYALVIDIDKPEIVGHTENCNSYEEAILAGITECLKLLEK